MPDVKAIVRRVAAPIHEKNLQERIQSDIFKLVPYLVRNPKLTFAILRKDDELYEEIKELKIRDLRTRFTDAREFVGLTRKSRPAVVYYQAYLDAVETYFDSPLPSQAVETMTADEFKALGFQVLAPEAVPELPGMEEICAIVLAYMKARDLDYVTIRHDGTVEEQPKPVMPEPRVRKFS
tara:strand:+ start:908 stop:1447 length:540 start_codon:yes stop_codon:yes gene_type:complete